MARLTFWILVFVLACAGGVVPRWCPPIGRRIGSPSLRHLHYPAVAPGPAVSYQSFGAASVLGGSTPSRGPRGAGAHGYPGTPDRRLISDCNERDPRSGAVPPLRRFDIALVPRLPVLGGYPAATPRFAPPCAGADCGDPPGIDPPGSGRFCRKTGSNLTPFRGSGRLFRFLAAIRVDVYGITPGQKHSHRRHPVPQPTKPPRTLLVRSAAERWMNIV